MALLLKPRRQRRGVVKNALTRAFVVRDGMTSFLKALSWGRSVSSWSVLQLLVYLAGAGKLVKNCRLLRVRIPILVSLSTGDELINPGDKVRGIVGRMGRGAIHRNVDGAGGRVGVLVEHGILRLVTRCP